MKGRKDFKIILNSNDVSGWTGASKFNAAYNVNLSNIITDDRDLKKRYKMSVSFVSTTDKALNNYISNYYLGVYLNNGGAIQNILTSQASTNSNQYGITTLLKVVPDLTIQYPRTLFQPLYQTTAPARISLTSSSGGNSVLSVGQRIDVTGNAGLSGIVTPAVYYVASYSGVVSVNVVDSAGVAPTLTSASGLLMTATSNSTYSPSYLAIDEKDRATTVINSLYNLSQITINIFNSSPTIADTFTTYAPSTASGTVNYTCCLHFEEIDE